MSSQIIYNTENKIDQPSLQLLATMCSLSNNLLSFDDDNQTNQALPSLIWVLRNFQLGHSFPKDSDYLEDALTEKHTDSDSQRENKRIISKWFDKQRRDCICLSEPASDKSGRTLEDINKNLTKTSPSDLRPKFNFQMNELIKLSRETIKPSKFNDGDAFIKFLKKFVDLINDESKFCLQDLTSTALQLKKKVFSDRLVSEIKKHLIEGEGLNEDQLKSIFLKASLLVQKKYEIDDSEVNQEKEGIYLS